MPVDASLADVLLVYSPPKMGKTSDALFSFPKAAFIGPPGGFKPSEHVVGYKPEQVVVNTISEANQYITRRLSNSTSSPPLGTVVVDDLSLLADNSWAVLSNNSDKFKMWNQLVAEVNGLIYLCRTSGTNLIMNTHEVGPGMKENAKERTFMPGGPKMPSVAAGQALAKSVDGIFRAVVTDTATGEAGLSVLDKKWPVAYRANREDADYTTGDRILGARGYVPANLGEILRAAGRTIHRLYAWQEHEVEQISNLFKENQVTDWDSASAKACFAKAIEHLRTKHKADNLQIRWTLRDAQSRYALRQMRADILTSYGA